MPKHLIAIPFHDWRKCIREGFRTRDAHLIEAFTRGEDFDKVLVVSRPITPLELALHRESRDSGLRVMLAGPSWHVFQDDRGCYVFEYFDSDVLGQILYGKSWFFRAYGSVRMLRALLAALTSLEMEQPIALSMNIRSARLTAQLAARGIPVAFDGFDNWLRFPLGRAERRWVERSYASYAEVAQVWFTNSESNSVAFEQQYGVRPCVVVPNGVDFGRFKGSFGEPQLFGQVRRPRVFFGGKITHLFDSALFNEVAGQLGHIQFVLAGQILDRAVWRRIQKHPNVHYLGDVHYDEYPAYVAASDACILPYVRDENSHGGNSIKLYEYAAAGKSTVSTEGNGAGAMSTFVTIANSPDEFAKAVVDAVEAGQPTERAYEDGFSWDERARAIAHRMMEMSEGSRSKQSPPLQAEAGNG
ncbi:MAG: hypothetical protein DMG25_00615 [Acidobacteria bacterium]|nr:MAG: hypothetical protein DMG25_00615 [Acidobacteriota bacterium]